jgi:hypothetical protein
VWVSFQYGLELSMLECVLCLASVLLFDWGRIGFWFWRYCKCEMPYNPDDLMVQCEGCKDW